MLRERDIGICRRRKKENGEPSNHAAPHLAFGSSYIAFKLLRHKRCVYLVLDKQTVREVGLGFERCHNISLAAFFDNGNVAATRREHE
jgi:hypothetical protein